MRSILVESAQRRLSTKCGKRETAVPPEENKVQVNLFLPGRSAPGSQRGTRPARGGLRDQGLPGLARFFGGMKHPDIAALLEINEKTVRRHWVIAKVWIHRALEKKN